MTDEEAAHRARQKFDDRMTRLEGHKVVTWESLSELMRAHLIYLERRSMSMT